MSVSARSQVTVITKTKVNSPSKHQTPQRFSIAQWRHNYGLEQLRNLVLDPLEPTLLTPCLDSEKLCVRAAKIWQDEQQLRNFIYKTHGYKGTLARK